MLEKYKTLKISNPEPKTVHGIVIKKQPIGKWLELTHFLEDLPRSIIQKMFPDQGPQEVLDYFKGFAEEPGRLLELLILLLGAMPAEIISLMCELMEADKDDVLQRLTPNEFVEVITEFWKVNDLTDFFGRTAKAVKSLMAGIRQENTGSKAG